VLSTGVRVPICGMRMGEAMSVRKTVVEAPAADELADREPFPGARSMIGDVASMLSAG